MKVVILNSGYGSRMGEFTKFNHKSMVEIFNNKKLISHQIDIIGLVGIQDILITTGHLSNLLVTLIKSDYNSKFNLEFVNNELYKSTNYIYSLFLALDKIDDDIILLHGDLYFTKDILQELIDFPNSCVVIDTLLPQPEKDFKARIVDGQVIQIATYIHDVNCIASQPLYKIKKEDWKIWANQIKQFVEDGKTSVYAEEALNVELANNNIKLYPLDLKGKLCMEVDTMEDLEVLRKKIKEDK